MPICCARQGQGIACDQFEAQALLCIYEQGAGDPGAGTLSDFSYGELKTMDIECIEVVWREDTQWRKGKDDNRWYDEVHATKDCACVVCLKELGG